MNREELIDGIMEKYSVSREYANLLSNETMQQFLKDTELSYKPPLVLESSEDINEIVNNRKVNKKKSLTSKMIPFPFLLLE